MNSPASFIFDGTVVVRAVDQDGDPWLVAADVCTALGIQNSRDTLAKSLDEDEKGVETIYTPGGPQAMSIVSESGVYALIFRSNKPEARRFRKWITAEVIPAIRKTGSYTFAQGAEREFLLRETEEAMNELRARRDIMNLELRRLDKRRRRLGGESTPRLAGRAPLALSGPGKPTALFRREDILAAIPAEGIRVRALQRRVQETTKMSKSRFYVLWETLKDSNEIHREGNLVFRVDLQLVRNAD